MKKTILTLALASLVGVVSAQKPAAGAMGFTGGLAGGVTSSIGAGPSTTGSLMFKYYVSDGLAARVGLNFTTPSSNGTTISDTTGSADPDGKFSADVIQTTKVTSGGNTWRLSLGAQKSIGGTDKLDVYAGGDLFFGGTTGKETDTKNETITVANKPAVSTVSKVGDFTQSVVTTAGSMNIGVNAVVGFQYFFVEKLSLGAEFAYGYITNRSSGTTETVNTSQVNGIASSPSGTGTTPKSTTTPSYDGKVNNSHGLGTAGATITLSFFF